MQPIPLKFQNRVNWGLDVLIFGVFLFIAYLSLPSNPFKLTPVVYIDSGVSSTVSNNEWLPPSPLVIDLDEDNNREVVIATAEPAVVLVKYSNRVPSGLADGTLHPSHQSSSAVPPTVLPYGTPEASSKGVYLFSELPEALSTPRHLDDATPHIHGRITSVRQVSLASTTKRRIVGLSHGAISVEGATEDADTTEESKLSRVLVVVTDDGVVHCYTRSLTLLWARELMRPPAETKIGQWTRDGANPVFLGTDVSVVVDESTDTVFVASWVHVPSSVRAPRAASDGDVKADVATASRQHLHVWALDAHSGELYWEHTENSESAAIPWEVFRKDILKLLSFSISPEATMGPNVVPGGQSTTGPSVGSSSAGTGIRLSHGTGVSWMALMRFTKSEAPAASSSLDSKVNRDDAWMAGISSAISGKGSSRNSEPKHSDYMYTFPNVLCIRHSAGLDVFHLKSGMHVAFLSLAPDAVYGPLWPGTIGSVAASPLHYSLATTSGADAVGQAGSLGSTGMATCALLVRAGVPPVDTVHTLNPCADAAEWHGWFSSSSDISGADTHATAHATQGGSGAQPNSARASVHGHEDISVTAGASERSRDAVAGGHGHGGSPQELMLSMPLLVPRDVVTHARSQGYQRYDVVVATSNGRVLCYRDGILIWNTDSGLSFGKVSSHIISGYHTFKPVLRLVKLGTDRVLGIVILFSEGLVVLDTEGTVLAQAEFPEPAGGALALGDVDGDGLEDVLVVTAKGYLLFAMEGDAMLSMANKLLAVVVAVLGVVLGALWLRRQAEQEEYADEELEEGEETGLLQSSKAYVRDGMDEDDSVEKHD